MAATRERRSNAGSKMPALLRNMDDEEFYTTTYGGFDEEEEDGSYASDQSDSDDVVDSDFSAGEDDEIESDHAESHADDNKRQKKKYSSRAYQEPKKPKEKKVVLKESVKCKTSKEAAASHKLPSPEKKSVRASTLVKRKETAIRQKEQEKRDAVLKAKLLKSKRANAGADRRRLTQEELLREAKKTEKLNLASLESAIRLEEMSKKKAKTPNKLYDGPIIRYHSVVFHAEREGKVTVMGDETQSGPVSRNFITFTDERNFREVFPKAKKSSATQFKQTFCPITKMRAKYRDPVTNIPYRDRNAFFQIREQYYRHMEEKLPLKQRSKNLQAWMAYWQERRKQVIRPARENLFQVMEKFSSVPMSPKS